MSSVVFGLLRLFIKQNVSLRAVCSKERRTDRAFSENIADELERIYNLDERAELHALDELIGRAGKVGLK